MYGLIFSTLQSLVVDDFSGGSDEKWKEICKQAGVKPPDKFLNHHYYDEAILYQVASASAQVLEVPLSKVLERFGAKFFEVISKSGHSSMLHHLGHNLYGFLCNLDSLHGHLSFTYTEMQAPSFKCHKTDEGLQLHYYSKRKGLQHLVVGIIKAVAADIYKLKVDMALIEEEILELEHLCHHCVFSITVPESARDASYLERLSGTLYKEPLNRHSMEVVLDLEQMSVCPINTKPGLNQSPLSAVNRERLNIRPKSLAGLSEDDSAVKHQLPSRLQMPLLPTLSSPTTSRRNSIFIPSTDDWPITPTLFQTCFPFHIIFDRDLVIKRMGISLNRLYPWAISSEAKITDYFTMERPNIPAFTYQHIREHIHNEFILRTKIIPTTRTSSGTPAVLQFRGQMIPTFPFQPNSPILFLGSPRVQNMKELESQGLYLSDIPLHDVTRDLILMNRHLKVEIEIARQLEETKKKLEEEQARVEAEKARADQLLHAMLPPMIAMELKRGGNATAKEYSMVTILFSDIKGFTSICNRCHPMQVVTLLNDLYIRFDKLVDKHKVYKVETIGDAYMVAAGLLDTATDHALAVTQFAFSMREQAGEVLDPASYNPLQVRIGINSGPIVAGVVGDKMPRYCLFGNTVNLASRMESTGKEGKVHVSHTTYKHLQSSPVPLHFLGKLTEVKGLKDKQRTYWVEPLPEGREHVTEILEDSEDDVKSNEGAEYGLRSRRSVSTSSSLHDAYRKVSTVEDGLGKQYRAFSLDVTSTSNTNGPSGFFPQTNQVAPADHINGPAVRKDKVPKRRRRHKCVIS